MAAAVDATDRVPDRYAQIRTQAEMAQARLVTGRGAGTAPPQPGSARSDKLQRLFALLSERDLSGEDKVQAGACYVHRRPAGPDAPLGIKVRPRLRKLDMTCISRGDTFEF